MNELSANLVASPCATPCYDDEDAKETDKERAKEVTENADAKARQQEEPEGAKQLVTKRNRTLEKHTSHEVEQPKNLINST